MPMILRKNVDLKQTINASGFSQLEFARRLGIGKSTIYRITHRKASPSPKLAYEIEKTLGVDHGDIFFAQSGAKMTQKQSTA